ncbi:MAG: methionyl-tRNA formyltransferase [Anaerovoracaceae bacterium]
MKVVYMGTPDFAVPPLEALAKESYEIGYVISQPDAVRDRGKKVKFTPVKEKAIELGIEVLQPEKIKNNGEFISLLKKYAPDVIVVAAYGKILPKEILDIPPLGCINIHGSLLPKYRGAAPIQRSILDGEEKTGITMMYMEEGLDTGAMLAAKATYVEKKNGAQLHDELSILGAQLLVETLPQLESNSITPVKQDDQLATYAPMINKKDGKIDFTKSPVQIERLIRAFDPWPGAFTSYKDQIFKIWQAEASEARNDKPIGTITKVSDEGIEISAGGKTLIAKVIQVAGKKRVAVKDYLKGNIIEIGAVLG